MSRSTTLMMKAASQFAFATCIIGAGLCTPTGKPELSLQATLFVAGACAAWVTTMVGSRGGEATTKAVVLCACVVAGIGAGVAWGETTNATTILVSVWMLVGAAVSLLTDAVRYGRHAMAVGRG